MGMIPVMSVKTPSNVDRGTLLRLAAASECDPSVIARIYEGRPVRGLSLARVRRGARELGIQLPASVAPSESAAGGREGAGQ
jgi:hypothetical protein